ncbi:unnamed protein product, partial [Iphiclides podalirius]
MGTVNDSNVAIATFYVKVILARTLKDYKMNIIKENYDKILAVIRICANIVSHFIYINRQYGWQDYEYRLSELLINDKPQFYSISAFNNGRFKQWLVNNYTIHEYSKELDDVSLPKEQYVEVVARADEFYVNPLDSDYCLSNIPYTPEPTQLPKMQPCRSEPYCFEVLHSSPSIAYTLSHRLLNVMMRHQIRRCYLTSPEEDAKHMDILCAFMYREAVYLARRGFFARDIFLEHIALCSLLGYEEFHRRQWFNKASSWIDDEGCVQENPNYEINKTSYLIEHRARSVKEAQEMRNDLRNELLDECHHHPMALVVIVMAHGIRQ